MQDGQTENQMTVCIIELTLIFVGDYLYVVKHQFDFMHCEAASDQ